MRRVHRIVIEIDSRGRLHRTAHGVGHHLPCRRAIPRHVAEWLRDQGVPVVVHRHATGPARHGGDGHATGAARLSPPVRGAAGE